MTRVDRLALVLVAAVTFAVFVPALSCGLLDWDDAVAIFANPHIRSFDWRWMFGELGYNPRYMPLTWLDWTVTYRLFGLRPLAYHLGNVVLHAANAALVYALVAELTATLRARVAPWRAAAATALATLAWSIHPLRVEPVTWATDRSYSQALLCALVAVLLHLSWVRTRRPWRYALAVAAFAAAVLSYPIVLGVAAVLFLLDVAPLGRPFDRARIVEKLPYLALAGGALALTALARAAGGALWQRPEGLGAFGVGARIMQAAYVWAYYAWRPLVPVGLAPVYTVLVDFRPLSLPFVASALFVVTLTAAAWALRRRAPWLLAAWGAHLVLLVPALGLTERPHYPNDRYDHVAAIVLSVLVAAALLRARAATAALAAALAVVVGLGVLSVRQQAVWRDDSSLYVHTLETLGDDPYRIDLYERLGDRSPGAATSCAPRARGTARSPYAPTRRAPATSAPAPAIGSATSPAPSPTPTCCSPRTTSRRCASCAASRSCSSAASTKRSPSSRAPRRRDRAPRARSPSPCSCAPRPAPRGSPRPRLRLRLRPRPRLRARHFAP